MPTEQLSSAVAVTAAGAGARHAEQLASAVVETAAGAEARQSTECASAVAKAVAGAVAQAKDVAEARHSKQLASALLKTAGGAKANHAAQHATAVARAVADDAARAKAVAEARHKKQLGMVPAGRAAARPVTKLEVGEPLPGEPVGTGLAAESPAMGGRPAREQTQALEAAHAAEDARLEQRLAVDLEKHLAEKEHVAEHKVSLAGQEDEFAQALNAEREKQAALATAKAVALAEVDEGRRTGRRGGPFGVGDRHRKSRRGEGGAPGAGRGA